MQSAALPSPRRSRGPRAGIAIWVWRGLTLPCAYMQRVEVSAQRQQKWASKAMAEDSKAAADAQVNEPSKRYLRSALGKYEIQLYCNCRYL